MTHPTELNEAQRFVSSILTEIIAIGSGHDEMRHSALGNDVMRSDTMVTNDYDWKLIVLIVEMFASQKFSTINMIAVSNLKIY